MQLKTSPKPLCFYVAVLIRIKSQLLLSAGCTLLSTGSFALGLGEVQTSTYLGQYLDAQVSLVDGERSYQTSELSVRQVLGSEAQSLGIELVSSSYIFLLELTGEGEALGLRVRSRRPVTEPYINFLISLEWASGSVYREYTLFLDPPPAISKALSSLTATSQERSNNRGGSDTPLFVDTLPNSVTSKKSLQGALNSSYSPALGARATDRDEITHYRIRGGDTLSKIAERWLQGTDETIRSTSRWLFENNPDAFTAGSEHQLLAGSLLRLPERSQLPLFASPVEAFSGDARSEAIADDPVRPSGELRRGNLRLAENIDAPIVDSAKALRAHLSADLDTNRELIDRLRRENSDLRGRLNKLEASDYVQMLTRLVELQNLQIDRLREEANAASSNPSEFLVASLMPSRGLASGAVRASAPAPDPLASLITSSSALIAVAPKTKPDLGVVLGGATAAALSEGLGERQSPGVRTWWKTVLLGGLPVLAVGLYLFALLRIRFQIAADTAIASVADVDHWQPDLREELEEELDFSDAVTAAEMDDLDLIDITTDEVLGASDDLSKPMLLLDEVLDREFEALVEASDFDPTCEFPDADDALFSQALGDIKSTEGKLASLSDVTSSTEPEVLSLGSAAASSDEGDTIGTLPPFNDSFEALGGLGQAGPDLHELDDLPGIDQDFGLNEAVQSAEGIDPLKEALPEPEFELSHDQQAEFEEDWLGEENLPSVADRAQAQDAVDTGDLSSEAESSLLQRRREDSCIKGSLAGVAKVLPFQRRRSDAEVRQSIQVKTCDYTPPDEAYVVCDCDDDTVLSLDFNLIDDPEFSEQGLNVDGLEVEDLVGLDAAVSDKRIKTEEVAGIVAAADSDAVQDNNARDGASEQPLFVDLTFRSAEGEGVSQISPR